jgi:hypothetical protein
LLGLPECVCFGCVITGRIVQAMPPNAGRIKLSLETAVVQQVLKGIVGEEMPASLPPGGLTPEDMAPRAAADKGSSEEA